MPQIEKTKKLTLAAIDADVMTAIEKEFSAFIINEHRRGKPSIESVIEAIAKDEPRPEPTEKWVKFDIVSSDELKEKFTEFQRTKADLLEKSLNFVEKRTAHTAGDLGKQTLHESDAALRKSFNTLTLLGGGLIKFNHKDHEKADEFKQTIASNVFKYRAMVDVIRGDKEQTIEQSLSDLKIQNPPQRAK